MKTPFFLFLLFTLIISTPLFAQQEKKDAALSPVGALGKISKGEKKILLNQMESELSKNYVLRSQEEFKRAQLRVFEELEAEECTEEACIRKIQELLQVDRLFSLQIIREGILTQITLTLSREDDKIVREDDCLNCDIIKLKERVGKLVGAVVLADLGAEAAKGGEVSQMLTAIIEREKEALEKEKNKRTSKENRAGKKYFIALNPVRSDPFPDVYFFESSGVGWEFSPTIEIGRYHKDFLFGLKYGTTSIKYTDARYPNYTNVDGPIDFTIEKTEFELFALWFWGINASNLRVGLGLGSMELAGEITPFSTSGVFDTFTADVEATYLTIGFGTQWMMDSGTVWQFDWGLFRNVMSSSKSFNYTQSAGLSISKFEEWLEDRIEGHFGGFYLMSFHLGFAF